jgi:PhnB protein
MNTPPNNPIVQPYLFFDGRCEEALEFYKKGLGARVSALFHYKDSPEPHDPKYGPPPPADKVMHARLVIGQSVIMVSDGHCAGKPAFEGFSMSITVSTEAEADRYFNALADGGTVMMPLTKTFYSPRFGMLKDRFGVGWMIMVEGQPSPQ